MTSPGGIELRIDELVLHGFEPRHRHAIATAVEQELVASLGARDPGFWRDGGAQRLDAGSFELPHDPTPAVMGTQIARVLDRELGAPLGGER